MPTDCWSRRQFIATLGAGGALLAANPTLARAAPSALPRRGDRPIENHPGLVTEAGTLVTRDGTRLRTVLTRPEGRRGRLPAILFVQWLSCDSIELRADAEDGWSRMIRRLARESGLVMLRTEKRGVGDSEGGPCSALDYLTELSDHRDALAWLRRSEHVDPARIVVFGASMGANYAPLVVRDQQVAGVITWGGGARPWFERMLAFERNRRELTGVAGERLDREMKAVAAFLFRYLVEGQTAAAIAAADPALGRVWGELAGTDGATHYGRPIAFHHQAQQQEWAAAWSRISAPVLVLYGAHDWYEDVAGASLIARVVDQGRAERASLRVIPATDHHFMRHARPEDAATGAKGEVNEGPVIDEILAWLRGTLG